MKFCVTGTIASGVDSDTPDTGECNPVLLNDSFSPRNHLRHDGGFGTPPPISIYSYRRRAERKLIALCIASTRPFMTNP